MTSFLFDKVRERVLHIWAKHPKLFIGFGFLVLLGGWYVLFGGQSETETRYVLGTVERGSVVASVSGSGQVSASLQVDLKPKAGGDVVFVGVPSGAQIKQGTLIVQLDAREAQKNVRDAEANLQSAQISLRKLEAPADNLSIIQSQNSLEKAKESKDEAEQSLVAAYESGFTAVSNAFLDIPDVMTGAQTLLFTPTNQLGQNEQPVEYYLNATLPYDERAKTFRDDVVSKYTTARNLYDKNFIAYKSTSRTSSTSTIDTVIDQTYVTAKAVSDLLKAMNNQIQFYKDVMTNKGVGTKSYADTQLTQINAYTSKVNSHLTSVLASRTTLDGEKTTIRNADRTIAESSASLMKLQSGTDALDLESARLTVTQRENALRDARETLANYFVRAPFDGTVASVDVRKGESVSAGTAVATIITKDKIAEISLNEVDVSRVKVGQPVTLTFDAVENLTISGKVAAVDSVGTVSQGVVSYTVSITFDTNDDRIKPGMSASASIITDIRQDALFVPQSSVKTRGGESVVEVFIPPLDTSGVTTQGVTSESLPISRTVVTGLSSDSTIEIVSGLEEGTQIVTRTITAQSKAATTQATPSLFGGGGIRVPR